MIASQHNIKYIISGGNYATKVFYPKVGIMMLGL